MPRIARLNRLLPTRLPIARSSAPMRNEAMVTVSSGSVVVKDTVFDTMAERKRAVRREDIISMDGDFTRGDVLHIYDKQGVERARGLSDFTSEEIRVLVSNPEAEAEKLLGYPDDCE